MNKDKQTAQKALDRVVKAYEANFIKVMAAVGTPKHTKYLKEEARLNKLSRDLKEYIGVEALLPNKEKICK